MSIFSLNRSTFEIQPQKQTRPPVVHHFWKLSLFFALLAGFPQGVFLWLQLNGLLLPNENYFYIVALHADIQILCFFGLFLAGFLFTAGFHLNGGSPRPFKEVVWVAPAIGCGLLLTLFPLSEFTGKLLLSACFLYAGLLMYHAAKEGSFPRPPITLLSVLGSLTMAIAPFMPLADPQTGIIILICGPLFFVYLAGMQLIPNIMKAGMPNRQLMKLFMALTLLLWLLCMAHLFLFPLPWWCIGSLMVLLCLTYLFAVHLVTGICYCGPTSLALGFIFGFTWNIAGALMLIVYGEQGVDAAIHLIAAGQITGHVIAVGSRVAGFFSGDYVMKEEKLIALLLCWQILPVVRGFDGFLFTAPPLLIACSAATAMILFLIWGWCMLKRLQKIGTTGEKTT